MSVVFSGVFELACFLIELENLIFSKKKLKETIIFSGLSLLFLLLEILQIS